MSNTHLPNGGSMITMQCKECSKTINPNTTGAVVCQVKKQKPTDPTFEYICLKCFEKIGELLACGA